MNGAAEAVSPPDHGLGRGGHLHPGGQPWGETEMTATNHFPPPFFLTTKANEPLSDHTAIVTMSDAAAPAAGKPAEKKSTSKPSKPAEHPKFAEMIVTAIRTLKDRSGSSLPAITKVRSSTEQLSAVVPAPEAAVGREGPYTCQLPAERAKRTFCH